MYSENPIYWRPIAYVYLGRRRKLFRREISSALKRLGVTGFDVRHGYKSIRGYSTVYRRKWRLWWVVWVKTRYRRHRPPGWVPAHWEEFRQIKSKIADYPVVVPTAHFQHRDIEKDFFYRRLQFIWSRAALPKSLHFVMARLWFWVLISKPGVEKHWELWCQVMSLMLGRPLPDIFEVDALIREKYKDIVEANNLSYIDIHELAAWTAWGVDEYNKGIPYQRSIGHRKGCYKLGLSL